MFLLDLSRYCSKTRIGLSGNNRREKSAQKRARISTEKVVFAWKSAAGQGLALPTVIARGKACLSAEELCEMAGICVAHLKSNIDNALLRFAK